MRCWLYAWIVATAACGAPPRSSAGDASQGGPDSGPSGTDAQLSDSPIDATLPIIPPEYECDVTQAGTVTVRTFNPNIPLLIHDVFGSLVSRTTSNSNGVAVVTVPGCGAVTGVFFTTEPWPMFQTVTYVRDGDDLFIATPPPNGSGPLGPARVAISNPAPGASSYFVLGPIASTRVPNQLAWDLTWNSASVDSQGLTTFAIHAVGANGPPDIHTYRAFTVSLADAEQTPLQVTSWSSATVVHNFHVVVSQPMQFPNVYAANWANGAFFWPYSGADIATGTAHDFSVELSAYGSGVYANMDIVTPSTIGWRKYLQILPPSTTHNLDLSDALLPAITGLTVSPSSSRPQVEWTLSTGVSPNIQMLRMRGAIDWAITLPPGRTSYQLPELPPDLAANLSTSEFSLGLHAASDYSGYAAARSRFVELYIAGRKYSMGLVMQSSITGDDAL